jgi:hypothetical protein
LTFKQVEAEIKRALERALQGAVDEIAERYRDDVSQGVSPPVSQEGRYPNIETGQGADNIDGLVADDELVARAGLYGTDSPKAQREGHDRAGGEHLQALSIFSGGKRKGLHESFNENYQSIVAATRRALQ